MATAPPPPPTQQQYYGHGPGGMPPIPMPNSELIVYLLSILVVGLVTLVDDKTITGANWLTFTTFATAAYLISRGLAKMRNVTETS
jgi:hypothetical protein